MYATSASILHAEAASAFGTGRAIHLKDRLKLNGKNSEWQLWIDDPARIDPSGRDWIPLINIRTTAENAMLARDEIGGLARQVP